MTTWVKVYNSIPTHPKMLAANAGHACTPGWLFVCGLCYANEHLTDGFIATHALPAVAPGTTKVEQAAGRLVEAGLWHAVEGGWRIHDYGEVQRSSGAIRERRAADAARKANSRTNGTPHAIQADSNDRPRGVRADTKRSPRDVRNLDVEVDVEGREQKADVKPSSPKSGPIRSDPVLVLTRPTAELKTRELCYRLAWHIVRQDPKAAPAWDSAEWQAQMRLLVVDRGGDDDAFVEVETVIDWCQGDSFWHSNILSPRKLRKQFTQLVMKAKAPALSNPHRESPSDLLRAINGGLAS